METGTRQKRMGIDRRCWVVVLAVSLMVTAGCPYLGLGGGESDGDNEKSSKSSSSDQKGDEKDDRKEAEADGGSEEMEEPPTMESGGEADAGQARPTRNPFASQVEIDQEEDEKKKKPKTPQLGPLRQHSISNYRLAGIMSEVTVPTAMFVAPDGRGYMVKEGESIGRRGGVIKDIRQNQVDIEIPPEKGEDEDAEIVTVELRREALPGRGEQEGLTKREREMLKRLRQKQEKSDSEGSSLDQGEAESGGGGGPSRPDAGGTRR